MKRRSFLMATSAAAVLAGATRGPLVSPAMAAPAGPGDPGGEEALVTVRTDLAAVAATISGLTLDGTVGDPAWGEPQWRSFTSLYELDRIDDVALHVVHDTEHLYLGVAISGARAATLSHVSVLLAGDGGYRTATVELRPGDPRPTFEWGGEAEALTTHRSQHAIGEDRSSCELAIPLSALGISGDPVGRTVAVNVVLDHLDQTDAVSTSVPTRTSVNRYRGTGAAAMTTDIVDEDRAATVHLGAVAPVADGRGAATVAQPESIALRYVDFTHKELRVDLVDGAVADQLVFDWRAPGGEWTRLTADPRPGRGGFLATLEHPAPLTRGQYQLRISVRARSGDDSVVLATFDRDALIAAGSQLPANRRRLPRGDETVTPAPASPQVTALLQLIPERNGFRFTGLPEDPLLHPDKNYRWSADDPDKLVAVSTGTVYPNDNFPEDHTLTVTNRLGETVEYPYHEDADGKRYFLSAHLWYQQRDHVYGQLPAVADEDPLGAARLLYRFAQVYQGWVPTNEYPWFNRPVEPASTPRNYYWGGVWTRWSIAVLGPTEQLGTALATVLRTNALDVLSEEVGEDVTDLIVNSSLHDSVRWQRSHTHNYTNNDYPSYVGMATLAGALGEPDYAHEPVEWAKEYLKRGFLFDGFWRETTLSYHLQSINGLFQVAKVLQGWNDPEGYESPRDGQRYRELDLLADMAVLAQSRRIPNVLVYPDSKLFPMADTWAYSRAASPDLGAGSVVYGGGGVARLARGGVSATGPFGIVQQFPELPVIENSVPLKPFPASGTLQFEANAAGESVTFGFTVERADSYDVDLLPFLAGSYGQYAISIDGTVITEFDFWSTTSGVAEFATLGRVDLTAGDHEIRFVGTGRNEASTNYKMGVVSLALLDEAAREQRDSAEPPETANPTQAYQLFTPKYGHNHWDPLSLALYAEDQELLPDIGYTHTIYSRWSQSTLAHNTVTVDAANMGSGGGDGGSIEVFDHADPAVQVMRVDFATAYEQTSRYQRETWLIEHPGSDRHQGYLLDLFRVVGGERHEFALNGDANRDAEMTTPTGLAAYGPYLLPEGVEVTEPETETDPGDAEGHYYGYIYVRDVQHAALPADGVVDVTLATSNEDEPAAHARILGVAGPDTELFLGRSPSMRATRTQGAGGDTNDEAVKWTMPKLVLRREGSDLRSDFVTVVEPYAAGTDPRIAAVERLEHDGGEGDLAVRVTHTDGTVDVVISTQADDTTVTAGGVTVTGQLGWARVRDGAATAAHLVGGTALTAPGAELTGTGAATGTITGTRRKFDGAEVDGLVTSASVADWVAGHTVVVTHPDGKTHGYPVKGVLTADGATVIELDGVDPGFTVGDDGSSVMTFTPYTEWSGETTFRIENSVSPD